jgi:RNA polymerase sigma-70 factor, ECF subfamily
MIYSKHTTNTNERELVRRILANDERALRSFYSAYKDKIYRFALLKISERKDAEEIFSDIFISAIGSLRDFTFSCSLSTYLYGIAKHKIIDYYRKQKIHDVLFSKIGNTSLLVSQLLTPEQEYSREESRKIIENVLRTLLPKYEKIIRLKYLEGLSVREIAILLSKSIKQTEALLFRARRSFVLIYTTWENQNIHHSKKKHFNTLEKRWHNKPILLRRISDF